ncbi:MAG: hypothetical protein DCC52_07890, partial [Chloroflexi bacterium]
MHRLKLYTLSLQRQRIEREIAPCPHRVIISGRRTLAARNDSKFKRAHLKSHYPFMSIELDKHFRYNYTIGILNGAIFGFVDALIAPSLTLAVFITTL